MEDDSGLGAHSGDDSAALGAEADWSVEDEELDQCAAHPSLLSASPLRSILSNCVVQLASVVSGQTGTLRSCRMKQPRMPSCHQASRGAARGGGAEAGGAAAAAGGAAQREGAVLCD